MWNQNFKSKSYRNLINLFCVHIRITSHDSDIHSKKTNILLELFDNCYLYFLPMRIYVPLYSVMSFFNKFMLPFFIIKWILPFLLKPPVLPYFQISS